MKSPAKLLRKEAPVTIAALLAIITVVQSSLEQQQLDGSVLVDWKTLAVGVGFGLVRKFVWSQDSHDDAIEAVIDQLVDNVQQRLEVEFGIVHPAQTDADTPAELPAVPYVQKPGS